MDQGTCRRLSFVSGFFVIGFLLSCSYAGYAEAAQQNLHPVTLKCDSLPSPLGIDDERPSFSWQVEGPGTARQTAYRIEVSTNAGLLQDGHADVWDSGKVTSSESLNAVFNGKALQPETRYSWRVTVWGSDGAAATSADSWWETGLMQPTNWTAKWISYLEPEEAAVREANAPWIANAVEGDTRTGKGEHDFRLTVNVNKPLEQAVLFVTGKDFTSAWANGQQVLKAGPMPPWKQTRWGTYTRVDMTKQLHDGKNSVAIGIGVPDSDEGAAAGSMSATLLLRAKDGSLAVYKSGPEWKAAFNAAEGWTAGDFKDQAWSNAAISAQTDDATIGRPWPTGTVKLLRKSFNVKSPVISARLYVTALGSYEMHLNGKKVGEQILAPGWTDYREQVFYQTYDVTAQIRKGSNAIGAYLAPGWYSTPLMFYRQGNNYGKTPPSLMAQLRLQHKDGSVEWVATDDSWKADTSPILQAEIYDGETYDARRVQAGWDAASFAATNWKPVVVETPTVPKVESQSFEPIHEEKVMEAKTVTSPAPGVYVYDFGQNMAAVPRMQFAGPAGTDVKLRFAEVLNADGTVYTDNLRTAKATDHFILAGNGEEQYQPRFTFHGFRYVEVTGVQAAPALSAVKAVVLHTNAPFTLSLESGSPMVNQLWSNVIWGQRSNFLSVPTDCPQRDERLGWAADAQVFWRTATYNMDIDAFSRKFSADLRGTQSGTAMYGIFAPGVTAENPGYGTGWSDAGVIIPWTAWIQYGDKSIAAQNWDAMTKYLDAIKSANPDFLWAKDSGIAFGDWLAPEQSTSIHLIATAYWAYDVSLMAQMAHALGKDDEAAQYEQLFTKIKAAFVKAYMQPDGTVLGPRSEDGKQAEESQTGYVLALNMNLVPEELRSRSADKLVAMLQRNGWRLGTGFLGTPYLLAVLTDTGHSDIAYRLLLNTEYPSWGYVIEHGATTTWERWNGDKMRNDPGMNSYNHYAYGAVADWIYRYAAGIDAVPEDAGFHTVYLHPHFDSRLGKLNVNYQSAYGEIKSAWAVQGNGGSWTVTLPANTTGRLPIEKDRYRLTQVNGVALDASPLLKAAKTDGQDKTYLLGPGTYTFHFEAQQDTVAVR